MFCLPYSDNNINFLFKFLLDKKKYYTIIIKPIINQQYKSTMQQKKQQAGQNHQGQHEPKVSLQDTQKKQLKGTQRLVKIYEQRQKQLIQQIRTIQNSQVQLQLSEQLTQQIKQQNRNKIKPISEKVVVVQKFLELAYKYDDDQNQNQTCQYYEKKIQEQLKDYKPTEQEILNRYNQLIQQPNDSNWTDATQSQADEDEIWAVDEQIMKAMEEDEEIDEQEQYMKQKQGNQDKKQEFNLEQLEEQFVVGQESDHHVLFGKHDKFCVSVNGIIKESLLVSGGGDDYMYFYKFPKEQVDRNKCMAPFHIVKHTQTVNKIQISFSKEYIFSMTDNQILCTEIKTQETTKLKSKQNTQKKQQKKQEKNSKKQQDSDSDDEQEPICSDMVCHHQGDVIAVSSGFQLEIYNIKGLKLYQTYYCERAIDMIAFTQSGKQIALACDDNKLRLLTPKTSEIVTVAGVKQHKSQISVLKTKGDFILSGCIDGYIGVTTIKKATMTTLIGIKQTEDVDGAINQLQFAGNYFISGSIFDRIDWYDFGKYKKLFQSPIQGSSSDICWQGSQYQHLYNVATIKGYIHIFDCRNPLKQVSKTRAGNTIHKLWADAHNVASACEDGHVRVYDIRKLI